MTSRHDTEGMMKKMQTDGIFQICYGFSSSNGRSKFKNSKVQYQEIYLKLISFKISRRKTNKLRNGRALLELLKNKSGYKFF